MDIGNWLAKETNYCLVWVLAHESGPFRSVGTWVTYTHAFVECGVADLVVESDYVES